MSGVMMRPMCGALVIVRQEGNLDFISGCWAEPDHDGPHLVMLLSDTPGITPGGPGMTDEQTVREATPDQLRAWLREHEKNAADLRADLAAATEALERHHEWVDDPCDVCGADLAARPTEGDE